MDISVYLRPATVAALRQGRSSDDGGVRKLLSVVEELGIDLRPNYPLAATPMHASQYHVQVEEPSRAEEVVRKLKGCREAVDTAFFVPQAEPPSKM